jgi:hypothetical protein
MSIQRKILYALVIILAVVGVYALVSYVALNSDFSRSSAQVESVLVPDKYFECRTVQCAPGKTYDAKAGYCIEQYEICGDGIDNDGDGLVDEYCHQGPTSPGDSNPPPPTGGGTGGENPPVESVNEPELCGDYIDNDGDGLVDENCPPPRKRVWWKWF